MADHRALPYEDELVCLEAGGLTALINPARGGDVLSLTHEATQIDVLWKSRRALREIPLAGPLRQDAGSFYDEYPGGIQELFQNTADSTTVEGADLPFHGEACRIPWSIEHGEGDDRASVALRTGLRRVPVSMKKTIQLDREVPRLTISSTVENTSSQRIPYSWGYHPAFGRDLLEGGCRLYLPADDVRIHGERFSARQWWEPGTRQELKSIGSTRFLDLRDSDDQGADLMYVTCREAWFVARNESTGLTITCTWSLDEMPFLWVWQECHDPVGYPWWGLEHVAGLEPHSNAPARELRSHIDQRNACWLDAGEARSASLRLSVTQTDLASHPVGVDALGQPILEEGN